MNSRTIEILKAIIDEYVSTAEPIGSKNLLAKYDFGVSSATIRSEMSHLENEGYISQPYTSAGRVPSEKGYRLYVDNLFRDISQKHYMIELINKIESLSQIDTIIEDISDIISKKTNYTALGIRNINRNKNKILSIHILEMKEYEYIIVIILENRKVEHRAVKVKKSCNINIEKITNYINKKTKGKTASQIKQYDYSELQLFEKDNKKFCKLVLKEIFNALEKNDDYDLYIKGKERFLNFPEYSNSSDAKLIMEAFNKKKKLLSLLDKNDNDNLNIRIGRENDSDELKNISIAKKTIDIGEYGYITIAIAGPTRMNYKKVIHSFEDLGKMIDELIKNY